MVAVQVGGSSDLKNIIQQSGMKLNMTDMNPGEPNDETFVKQVKFVLWDNNITLFRQSIIYLIIASNINICRQNIISRNTNMRRPCTTLVLLWNSTPNRW